jgi:8-oxo-dGTP diphosphatase
MTTEETTTEETAWSEELEVVRYAADVVPVVMDAVGRLHVALIRRGWDPHKGSWALPGGHVDAGETSRTAAARELQEETGLQVDDAEEMRLVGVFDTPDRDPRGRYVSVAYLAELGDAEDAVAGDDAEEAEWWCTDALPDLAFDHADIIRAALKLL